ncbi:MAG: hypothetical protein QXL22_02360 [Candidatus Nezhaarchaeales archaeon]
MRETLTKKLTESIKLWLARRRLIVLAEAIKHEKKIYRVYCPKCKTWYITHLSVYPENKHFHLPCSETVYM